MSPIEDFAPQTLAEIIRLARQRLPARLWSHAACGIGSETTLRRNRVMMESVAFRPRLMRGAESVDISTSLFGVRLSSPLMYAPVGTLELFAAEGAAVPARLARELGLVSFYSVMAWPGIADVGAAGGRNVILQIYLRGGNREWLTGIVRAAEEAGYLGLCLTADSIGGGTRDRQLLDGFRELRSLRRPNIPVPMPGAGQGIAAAWNEVDWLRSVTSLPILVKGITTPEDAREAIERGANGVYVSNHGGRALDGLPSTIEVLAEIAEATAGRAEIVVDGGFLRGEDVVKALALGARGVGLGKLQVWALAAGGETGLRRATEILTNQVEETFRLLGVRALPELDTTFLRPSAPTRLYADHFNEYEWAPLPPL
jgi:4-hydroxymandelate oxidase